MALSSTNSSLNKNPEMDDSRVFIVPVIQQYQNDDLAEAEDFTELMDMDNILITKVDNSELHNNPLNNAMMEDDTV